MTYGPVRTKPDTDVTKFNTVRFLYPYAMVTYSDNGMVSFTIKLDPDLILKIEEYAKQEKRKRSNCIIYLMDIGFKSDHTKPDRFEGVEGGRDQVSVSTKYSEVVRQAETIADTHFAGVFSNAVRWGIRSGLREEGAL